MKAWKVKVEIKPWPDGGYIARAPSLQGCWVVAPTVAEAVRDIYEVIEMSITSRIERCVPLPEALKPISEADLDGRRKISVEVPVAVP